MKVCAIAIAIALTLSGCCFSEAGVPGFPGAGLPGAGGSLLPPPSVPYTPDPWLVNWGPTYESRNLADNNPATYWCAPSGTAFPIVTIMQLSAPTHLASVDFDGRVAGYETSAIREVSIEPLGAGGVSLGLPVHAVLNQNAITTVPVSAMGVQAVRFSFDSNYGGSYAVLAELALRIDMGRGLAPLPPGTPGPVVVTPPVSVTSGTDRIPSAAVGIPYVVGGSLESFAGYGPELMHDGNPASYWCSPPEPHFPTVMTVTLSPPSLVSALEFDTTNAGYPTIGPAGVTILALSGDGSILNLTSGHAEPNTVTRIPLLAPVVAAQFRITLQDNHGGPYLGISELAILP